MSTSEIEPLIMSSSEIDARSAARKNEEEEEFDSNFSQLIHQEIDFVKESFEEVKRRASQKIDEANETRKQFEELMLLPEDRAAERKFKLRRLKKKVSKLRFAIPFKLIAPQEKPHPNINWRRPESDLYPDEESRSETNIDDDHGYDDSSAPPYHELESIVRGLDPLERRCISCFLSFPKNAVIKKSVLYWSTTYYGFYLSDETLGGLVRKGLVQKVYKKSNLTVAGYRMYPSVHSNLKKKKRSNISWFKKKRSNISWWFKDQTSDVYVGHSHDVNEKEIYHTAQDFQRFITGGREKLFLHLGKWNNSTEHHIEVIDPKLFFKVMSKLTGLWSVSLRGISMIEELPNFITQLKGLCSLDLNSCHNLEVIPSSIANLQNTLLHLDMSGCYFLDRMPKALATLHRLRVLKGFFVGETEDENVCTLEDLAKFEYLGKLNIYTSMKGFPNISQFKTLQNFGNLHSLTISWGGCCSGMPTSSQVDNKHDADELNSANTFIQQTDSLSIEKLDLQCVPETVTPHWLKPANFKKLKKLYIRGGNFFDLGQSSKETKWDVEILRLKHLSKLHMDWPQLEQLFPKLIFLEMGNCPNLVQFPCDNNGFFRKNVEEFNDSSFFRNIYSSLFNAGPFSEPEEEQEEDEEEETTTMGSN